MGHRSDRPGSGAVYGRRVAEVLAGRDATRRLTSPHATGEAGSVACGAVVRIELALEGATIAEAAAQAYGCPATLASAQEIAHRASGSSILAAAAVTAAQLAEALELTPDKIESAELAVDALQAALTDAISRGYPRPPAPQAKETGVLVGMSGGVDSTVAAMLLRDRGLDVVGVTLSLWSGSEADDARSCCSPVAVQRARRAAHGLGIPHLTLDATALFREAVVDYFVQDYRRGRTPNPCCKCNSRVRFGLLADLARRFGLAHVATGHYAGSVGEARALSRGVDLSKDQSYVLAEVDPGLLSRVMFPLGQMTKKEVRRLAAAAGVTGHDTPESQDICFVPDGDYRGFLRERLGERPGDIVDQEGTVVGRHSGTYGFTIGQRKGLAVSRPSPLYVTAIDAQRNQVTIGAAGDSAVRTIEIDAITWHALPDAEGAAGAEGACGADLTDGAHAADGADGLVLQFRSNGAPVEICLVDPPDLAHGWGRDRVTIRLEQPASGVAAGQTAVIYAGPAVVMAGTIVETGDREQQRT